MIRFAADEDFDNDILRALRRRLPEIDLVRAQDAGLRGADDPQVLEWAALESRVLVTHDVSTMTGHAIDRMRRGEYMPGVIAVHQHLAILRCGRGSGPHRHVQRSGRLGGATGLPATLTASSAK